MRGEYLILKTALRECLADVPWTYFSAIIDAKRVTTYGGIQTFPIFLDVLPEYLSPMASPFSRKMERTAA